MATNLYGITCVDPARGQRRDGGAWTPNEM